MHDVADDADTNTVAADVDVADADADADATKNVGGHLRPLDVLMLFLILISCCIFYEG